MILSTFNIQNNYRNYNLSKANNIYNYFNDYNIDILCMQEVFDKCDNDLITLFNKHYYVGKYRYILMPFFRKKNEKNPIISRYKIIKYKTYYLPFIPSKYKRILTHAVVEFEGIQISIYNTHIEIHDNDVKKRQLNRIIKIINKDNRPKIIVGDFNSKINNTIFLNFINCLEDNNIYRVDFNGKTLKASKDSLAIDHIFLSDDFIIKKKKLLNNIEFSDHYPLLVEIELK